MSAYTDTERLDWLSKYKAISTNFDSDGWLVVNGKSVSSYKENLRVAIDAAMDAEKQAQEGELKEAWEWFIGQSNLVSRKDRVFPNGWVVAEAGKGLILASPQSRDEAILAAYRASKEKP